MPKTEVISSSYSKLLKDLKSILVQRLKRIEEERVKAYWRTGELISKYLLGNKARAGYGDNLFERLSEDLEIGQRTLERSVQFYREFPIPSARTELGWLHYRILITVQEKEERLVLENRAVKENWSARQLQEHIRLERLEDLEVEGAGAPAKKLKVRRGRLYTYRLIKPEIINSANAGLLVDCGFYFWKDLSLIGISEPAKGDVVESVSAGGGSSYGGKTEDSYSFKYSEAKRKQLYTYKALVERVVDADTAWVHIDLGFNSWSRQKIRFRGIDAPEISTQKGKRAKEFVEAALSKVSFIIIKSTSRDKYGRPLSDIFYLPAGRQVSSGLIEREDGPQEVLEKGPFLNQELLDKGLAVLV